MLLDQYADALTGAISQIRDTQREKILQAAQMVSDTICAEIGHARRHRVLLRT